MSIVVIELDQSVGGREDLSSSAIANATCSNWTSICSIKTAAPAMHSSMEKWQEVIISWRRLLVVTTQEASLASRSQALPCGLIVGIYASHHLPERGRVIHFDEVGQFVGHDVIHKIEWLLDQAPVKADYPT